MLNVAKVKDVEVVSKVKDVDKVKDVEVVSKVKDVDKVKDVEVVNKAKDVEVVSKAKDIGLVSKLALRLVEVLQDDKLLDKIRPALVAARTAASAEIQPSGFIQF
ncbi:hypothetical protein AC1031_015015 [Aphanomyces cochlioides]|nr:hypothetical protein AC1031_015015 [Aphanomyces cochlioides]